MVDDEAGETVAAHAPTVGDVASAPTQAADGESVPPLDAVNLAPPGYQLGALLGRGGMGEVIAAHDQRIGREVAYKRMRNAGAGGDALSRFLREARIQARLDHPAIVPVHEMGTDADGRPFFTMKRLAGKTLADRLQDPSAPRQPLLRAFAEVCLAVELAHSKGIVHRDLKPSNIMLGDFGEVYVLDWGIARVLTQRARRPTGADAAGDLDSIGEATSGGTLLGTLGYMAPEQVRGEEVDGKADVYALGSILFEMLAAEPLHPRGHAAVASTLAMERARPVERAPDRGIAPELDALCAEMLEADPGSRPTARAVAERVQRYLDGDRDLAARRALAQQHLATARALLSSGTVEQRAEALRAAGRALALDPYSEAADLVTALIVEPPTELPKELQARLADQETQLTKGRARRAFYGYRSFLLLGVTLPLLQVKSWPWMSALFVGILLFMAIAWRTSQTGRTSLVGIALGTAMLSILFGRVAGPFVLVPLVVSGTLLSISNIAYLNDRPWLLYLGAAVASILPYLIEWVGLLTPTLFLTERTIEVRSAVFDVTGGPALPALLLANVVGVLIIARFAVFIARDRRVAQRSLTIQAWHLGHLLPQMPHIVGSPKELP
jgi:serine/threonine-protein kinase